MKFIQHYYFPGNYKDLDVLCQEMIKCQNLFFVIIYSVAKISLFWHMQHVWLKISFSGELLSQLKNDPANLITTMNCLFLHMIQMSC